MARKPIILDVDTGYETVQIRDNGEIIGEFKFNPADSNIATRFDEVVKYFESVKFDGNLTEAGQTEQLTKVCTGIREQFNYLFGGNVADGIFQNCGPLSITSTGEPYFSYILDKIADVISAVCDERNKQKMEQVLDAVGEYADTPTLQPLA